MKRKMLCALLAGLLLCGGLLGGCAGDTGEESSLPYVEEEQAENDGSPAQLVLGTAEADADRAAVLEEIAEKYTADFPNTQVEVRSYGSEEALQAALASGEADIGEMEEADVPQAVEEGLLLDLYDWVDTWEERYSLSQEAWQAIRTMGKDHAYVIPYDFDQLVTYYRADWFEEYNATAESAITPREWCRNWNQIARTVERLGEKGKVAFGGKERLGQLFDAALWGDLSLGRLGAQGAAYFAAGDEHLTIFTWEMLPEAVENFKEHYQSYTLPQSLEWTEDQAVEAFLNGEAAILFAGSGVGEELAASLPEGSWGTIGPVQGATGASVISDQYVGWAVSAHSEEPEIAAHFSEYRKTHNEGVFEQHPLRQDDRSPAHPRLRPGDGALPAGGGPGRRDVHDGEERLVSVRRPAGDVPGLRDLARPAGPAGAGASGRFRHRGGAAGGDGRL